MSKVHNREFETEKQIVQQGVVEQGFVAQGVDAQGLVNQSVSEVTTLSFSELIERIEVNLNTDAIFAYKLAALAEARAQLIDDTEKFAQAKSLKGASLYKQDKAKEAIQELAIARKLTKEPLLQSEILNRLAYSYFLLTEYKKAILLAQKALKIAQEFDTKKGRKEQVFSHNTIGISYNRLSVYDVATTAFLNGLEVIDELDSQKGHLNCNLGLTQQTLGNYDNAFKYTGHALEIAIEQKKPQMQATILGNFGYFHLESGNYADAISFANQALSIEQIPLDIELYQFLNLAEAYRKLGDYSEAQVMIKQAKDILENYSQDFIKCDVLHCESRILYRQGNYKDAEKIIHEARKLAEKIDYSEQLYKIHLDLSMVYEELGEATDALKHHKAYHDVKEQVHNAKAERRIEGLMIQHQVEELIQEKELTVEENSRLEKLVHQRTIEIEEAHMEMLERLAIAGEKRDDDTGEHTARVGRVCGLIAKELGCDDIYVDNIRIAARLHDIGKIGVPDSILLKPSRLTEAEFEIIKTHSKIGEEMLANSKSKIFQMAERIAGTHHERWDGRGYPKGISGADIPLEGRIVAVADVYDALTNDRPYKDTWEHKEALEELFKSADSHLDRNAVEAFSRLFDKGLITVEDLQEKPKEKSKTLFDQEIFVDEN